MTEAHWLATLSDGSTAVEGRGEWQVVPGEAKPWRRLVEYITLEGLHITSLRFVHEGKEIFLPPAKFERFNLVGKPPDRYAIQHYLEVDDLLGEPEETRFTDLIALYDDADLAIHHVFEVGGSREYIVVTDRASAHVPSPRQRS